MCATGLSGAFHTLPHGDFSSLHADPVISQDKLFLMVSFLEEGGGGGGKERRKGGSRYEQIKPVLWSASAIIEAFIHRKQQAEMRERTGDTWKHETGQHIERLER